MGLPKEVGSCNDELHLGMVEGSYKMVVRDRGGVVETLTYHARKDLSVTAYGITETPDMELPDGSGDFRSPYAVVTPVPGMQVTNQPN